MTDIFGSRGALWLDEQATGLAKASTAHANGSSGSDPVRATTVTLLRGDEVVMRPIPWLWDGYIAGGRLSILAGRPGTGKTTAALALAATVTVGGRWPDGTRATQGNIAVWSGEDDPADTLKPRLVLAGADVTRVLFVGDSVRLGERRAFDPATDMDALRQALAERGGCSLLIVDPVVSAIAGDSHKNAEVRRSLAPLCDLAAQIGCAVVGITHLSKGTEGRDPTERVVGSMAFGALARTVLMTTKRKNDAGEIERLLLRSKNNLGADDGGFRYDIEQGEVEGAPGFFASRVLWGEAVKGDARELLAEAEAVAGEDDYSNDAETFLLAMLRDTEGKPISVATKALMGDAAGAGIAWRTVERAKKRLGVVAEKTGMRGGWEWRLPMPHESQDRQKKPKTDTLGSGDLREKVAALSTPTTAPGDPRPSGDDYVEMVL